MRVPGQIPKGVLGLRQMKMQNAPRPVREDEEHVFEISSQYGVFEPKQTLTFTVSFAPRELFKANRVSKLHVDTSVGGAARTCDHLCVSVPITGIAQSHSVTLAPSVLKLAGKLLLGKRYVREVILTNYTSTPAPFHFVIAKGDVGLVAIEPWSGVIEPHGVAEVLVKITPQEVGSTRCVVTCDIEHGPSLPLLVEGVVTGPSVVFESGEVDYGLVKVDTKELRRFNLRNLTDVSADFKLSVVANPERGCVHALAADITERLVMEPSAGVIPPRATIVVTSQYNAGSAAGKVRGTIACDVVGGPTQYVSTRADVLAPNVAIDQSVVDIGVSFVNVPVTRKLVLRNLTKLPSRFAFDPKTLGPTAHLVGIEIVPNNGIIGPAGTRNLTVTFMPKAEGFADIVAACDVVGMPKPLGFRLKTEVKGLVVSYSIFTADDYERYNTFSPAKMDALQAPPTRALTAGSVSFAEANAGDEVTLADLPAPAEGASTGEGDAAAAGAGEPEPPKRVPMDGELLLNYGDDCQVETHHEIYLVVFNESSIPSNVTVAIDRLGAPPLEEE